MVHSRFKGLIPRGLWQVKCCGKYSLQVADYTPFNYGS
jgi:hypothetical protein